MRDFTMLFIGLGLWLQACGELPATSRVMERAVPYGPSMIVGNDPAAVEAAAAWMHAQHLPVVGQDEMRMAMGGTESDAVAARDARVVQAAKTLRATALIYVKAFVKPLCLKRPPSDENAVRQDAAQTIYSIRVAIRAVDVTSGVLLWEGSAKSVYPVPEAEPTVIDLTKQAMATALSHAPAN